MGTVCGRVLGVDKEALTCWGLVEKDAPWASKLSPVESATHRPRPHYCVQGVDPARGWVGR